MSSMKLPAAVPVPVIGNGDLTSAVDVAKRRRELGFPRHDARRHEHPVDFQQHKILFRAGAIGGSTGRSREMAA